MFYKIQYSCCIKKIVMIKKSLKLFESLWGFVDEFFEFINLRKHLCKNKPFAKFHSATATPIGLTLSYTSVSKDSSREYLVSYKYKKKYCHFFLLNSRQFRYLVGWCLFQFLKVL